MKRYTKEILSGVLLFTIFVGLALWYFKFDPRALLEMGIALLLVGIGIFAWVKNIITKKKNMYEGAPAEDEFTKMARLHASSQAYFYSMYLWFFIFFFRSYFTKAEELLGLGIMGSAIIYFVRLWRLKSEGGFDEQ